MKKVILSLLLIGTASIFAAKAQTTAAAPLKIGIFDMSQFVQSMPAYKTVIQPKLDSYAKDTLGPQHDNLQLQYQRQVSALQADSAAKKSSAVLSYDSSQLQQTVNTLVNWQQIAQQLYQQKQGQLAQPYVDTIMKAYKKAIADNHITLVLSPQVIEDIPDPSPNTSPIVNLFDVISKAMHITLDNGQTQQQAQPAAGGGQ
jgi:Skp family chaperone for outer membrane proteins